MQARVRKDYHASYPAPLKLHRGAAVHVEPRQSEWPNWLWCTRADGLAGWAPRQLFAVGEGPAVAGDDYDATELTVNAGETVQLLRELNGWWWCSRNQEGQQQGWLPGEILEIAPAPRLGHRFATETDIELLADWNHQLIEDEGHRNPMTVAHLRERMRGWLKDGEYRAVLFLAADGNVVAYGLYHESADDIYLRQFFVHRDRRRSGIGRSSMELFFEVIWPKTKRLTVDVLCGNPAALQFWRAVGYRDYSIQLEKVAADP